MAAALTLTSLPLFPLQAVLFPGGSLALRVFEVRYLDMVSKCQQVGAPFGVVCLTHGSEVRSPSGAPTQFHSLGTLARIHALERPQAGLITLQVQGCERFVVLQRHLLTHGLWVADVQQLTDDSVVAIPADLQPIAQALAQVLQRLPMPPSGSPPPAPNAQQLNDCGWVANRWCELLPIPLELKQQMMALDNPLVRLELVGDVLQRTGIAP